MDIEQGQWIAELIGQALAGIENQPGLTIEVEDRAALWLQVLLESDEYDPKKLSGFVLNFPYRGFAEAPLQILHQHNITPPPDTKMLTWDKTQFATLWLRPDTPLIGLALFIGDIFSQIIGADNDADFNIQIEYGY